MDANQLRSSRSGLGLLFADYPFAYQFEGRLLVVLDSVGQWEVEIKERKEGRERADVRRKAEWSRNRFGGGRSRGKRRDELLVTEVLLRSNFVEFLNLIKIN